MKIGIPRALRFPLVWVIFFAIIGIIMQSIEAKYFVFVDFFTSNYIDWFKSFGNFSHFIEVENFKSLTQEIIAYFYYFFYTGGLLSLLWAIISTIINYELNTKKTAKYGDKPTFVPVINNLKMKVITAENYLSAGNKLKAKEIYQDLQKSYKKEFDTENLFPRIMKIYEQVK